jgi:radical SAM superfamily enzyme YgiQ (UPF0313 family)
MNDFHLKRNFATSHYGSADSFPPWLFRMMAGEPRKDPNGEILFSPYPLRKIESRILELGYSAKTVSPGDLARFLDDTRILGVHCIDPLGRGTTPVLRDVMGFPRPYSVKYFRRVLGSKEVRKRRREGLRVIVGGAGSWQFADDPAAQRELGIDCVIVGEAENIISTVIDRVNRGEELPRTITCEQGDIPETSEIETIRRASNFGCVEIGRGCIRGCKFCDVAKNRVRWLPYDHIEKELRINADAGLEQGLLHSEDCLLYGQDTVTPDPDKFIKLISLVKKYYRRFQITHFSLAAVSASPEIVPRGMEIILEDQDFILGQTGIETASERLLGRTMSGKVRPFRNDEWVEVIHNSMGILHDNGFIPYCSFILGLPGEEEEDVIRTIDLVDDLDGYRSILLPGRFTPLGRLKDDDPFSGWLGEIDRLHLDLIRRCIAHNIRWVDDIRYKLFADSRYRAMLHLITKAWMFQYRRRAARLDLV